MLPQQRSNISGQRHHFPENFTAVNTDCLKVHPQWSQQFPAKPPSPRVCSFTPGTLCICLNPKDLNKTIVQEHYKASTLDQISRHLSGAIYFSKLDTKDGFWSIILDEKSSYLTTFNMHCGMYRFLHMLFGLKMSQDVFQMQMDQVTDCLPGIIAIHDDICIYNHTLEDHDWQLLQLMQTAKQHGIVFNSSKCQIMQHQIAFFGTVFTTQGMQPNPSKMQALQLLPTPNSQVKLQFFMGLINYL